ncbi:hypothetical protein Tco_1016493 [Tanacetum coccineum]|uniref:Uncharacterized protein n=1 Tax=Tanacetum coccineum TaxID=301880 RepID=A0ABQ5FQ42_9ASTR
MAYELPQELVVFIMGIHHLGTGDEFRVVVGSVTGGGSCGDLWGVVVTGLASLVSSPLAAVSAIVYLNCSGGSAVYSRNQCNAVPATVVRGDSIWGGGGDGDGVWGKWELGASSSYPPLIIFLCQKDVGVLRKNIPYDDPPQDLLILVFIWIRLGIIPVTVAVGETNSRGEGVWPPGQARNPVMVWCLWARYVNPVMVVRNPGGPHV